MSIRRWFGLETERQRWGTRQATAPLQQYVGLPALDAHAAALYGRALPRGVPIARLEPERAPVNHWMAPAQLLEMRYEPGHLVLGKLANSALGFLDDRPMVTLAGARAGKTSTVLEPNLYLYPGSMVVLDPKGELAARTAHARRLNGHSVQVLDPFGQSGLPSANFNLLSELDPTSPTIVDDVMTLTQAIIVDEGDSRSQHWNNSARALLKGIILLTLDLPPSYRNLVTVRQLLTLTHPLLDVAVREAQRKSAERRQATGEPPLSHSEEFYAQNKAAVETLLMAMARKGNRFGGVLAATGKRFASTPLTERGSIFSTAAAQTDFLDSIPLRAISQASDFPLASLRADRPTTIYLCLPVGRMESHFRWLRMIVQQACTTLEKLGTYPRNRPPILFMMEEFATLGHMDIMERAAAYFPGFGVKLWAVLQDVTQLQRYYQNGWETFLGNAGVVQCFANGDQATLDYISKRLEELIKPFEIRTAFSRESHAQLLMMEGKAPAAAIRLEHYEVEGIRSRLLSSPRSLPLA